MKLNRRQLLIISFVIILSFLGLNRIRFINNSVITNGEVIGHKEWVNEEFPKEKEIAPIIKFSNDTQRIVFTAQKNLNYNVGSQIKVIYKKQSPHKAKIYTFLGFWLKPIIVCIIPLILIFASIFTFLAKDDIIYFSNNKIRKIKKNKTSHKSLANDNSE